MAYPSASAGEAFTSYDYTAYYHVVPRAQLVTVMQLEANRMAGLRVSHAALVLEQEEIVAERHTEIDDVPERRLDLHLRALLYDTHPYGVPVLGWPEEVARLTPQDVTTFHHTWYAPNNAMLIIAGDITAITARATGAPVLWQLSPLVTCPPGSARVSLRSLHGRGWSCWSPTCARRCGRAAIVRRAIMPGRRRMRMPSTSLAEILAGEATRRLTRPLVGHKRLATAVHVDYMPDRLGVTEFTLHTTPAPGVEIEVLEQAIDQALAEVVARGVSPTDVHQAQQRLRCQPPLPGIPALAGADILGMGLTTGRTLTELARWQAYITAVTPSEVHAAAQAVLRVEQSVTGVLLPVAAGNATGIAPRHRKKQ